jgi:D-proline reductase (dithiol) PrdB
MEQSEKRVDGFRFLPPGLKAWVQTFIPDEEFQGSIPWTPLSKPLRQATVALVTSAGISLRTDPPFDMEESRTFVRCRSYRGPEDDRKDIDVNHLPWPCPHIKQDINVMPLTDGRFEQRIVAWLRLFLLRLMAERSFWKKP